LEQLLQQQPDFKGRKTDVATICENVPSGASMVRTD
jgi:hypothetical protein